MQSDYEKLMNYAFRLLASKRYTSFEISKKLTQFLERHELEDEDLIESALKRLIELKYIDDAKYAADYVNDRVKLKPKGEFLIKRELKLKGIDEELIDKTIESKEIDESELASIAFEKKLRQWEKLDTVKIRQKAFSFLSSRGFRPDTIYKVINTWYGQRSLE